MTQSDKSVNIFGKVEGIISTGNEAKINQNIFKSQGDIANEIEEILEELAKKYPDASVGQKQNVLEMEIQQRLKQDPTFKQRFIGAAKSGGLELVKVITDNPFISVPLETIKGWIEAE